MKFISKFLEEPVDFSENSLVFLQVASPKLRASLLEEITNQDIDKPHLIENCIEWLDFQKSALIISDYLNFDNIEKKICSKFLSVFLNNYRRDDDKGDKIRDLIERIKMDILLFDNDIDAEIGSPSYEKILKCFDIEFLKYENTIYNKLYKVVKLLCNLNMFRLLIFVAPRFFLSSCEIEEIGKLISYSNMKLLVVEDISERTNFGITIQIDNDLNEIR